MKHRHLIAALAAALISACGGSGSGGSTPTPPPPPPPAAFLDNTPVTTAEARAAVAKVLSVVRFYYPSQAIQDADWDRLGAYTFAQADKATTRGQLVQALSESLHPVAPALSLNGYQRKPIPAATGTQVAWRHQGSYVAKNYQACLTDLDGRTQSGEPTYTMSLAFFTGTASPGLPTRPHFTTTVEGGVQIDLPLVLPASGEQALPSGDALPAAVAQQSISAGERYANLSAAATIWGGFKNFFPYQSEVPVDFDAQLAPLLASAASAADLKALSKVLLRFTAQFQDGHNFFIPNAVFDGTTTWGLFHTEWVDQQIVVAWVSPRYSGPVQRGDVITQIRGQAAADFIAEQSPWVPLAPEKRALRVAQTALNYGAPTVNFKVQHANGQEEAVTLTRESWSDAVFDAIAQRALPILQEVEPGIFVFKPRNAVDPEATLASLKGANTIIFDARNAGLQDPSLEFTANFIPAGLRSQRYTMPLYAEPWSLQNQGQDASWADPPVANPVTAKSIVLMDRHTQSSGETWLNFFKENHYGQLIGEATHGANGDITCMQILGGASGGGATVFYTGMHVANRDGSRHHAVGTLPDIEVKPTLAGIRAGRDELMEKALELAHKP